MVRGKDARQGKYQHREYTPDHRGEMRSAKTGKLPYKCNHRRGARTMSGNGR
jgi:hypothetical protein